MFLAKENTEARSFSKTRRHLLYLTPACGKRQKPNHFAGSTFNRNFTTGLNKRSPHRRIPTPSAHTYPRTAIGCVYIQVDCPFPIYARSSKTKPRDCCCKMWLLPRQLKQGVKSLPGCCYAHSHGSFASAGKINPIVVEMLNQLLEGDLSDAWKLQPFLHLIFYWTLPSVWLL